MLPVSFILWPRLRDSTGRFETLLTRHPRRRGPLNWTAMQRANVSERPDTFAAPDRDILKVGGRGRDVDFTLDDRVPIWEAEEAVRRYLAGSRGWFVGEAVTVNAGRRIFNSEELYQLRLVFEEEFQVLVSRFWCDSEKLGAFVSGEVGVPVSLTSDPRLAPEVTQVAQDPETTLFVKTTCRSGTRIDHQGDVIVRGDVNPGAEIAATGDIVVLGTLRGVAHAGAGEVDSTTAVIIAFSLRPLQLRIGRYFGIPPAIKESRATQARPEIAYVQGERVMVAPYNGRFRLAEERRVQ